MKKHNEGYTLAMVLVVITVLCVISASVATVSLRNLKAQRTSFDRLEAKYQAQGQVEMLVAQLEQGYDCDLTDEKTAAKEWLDKCGIETEINNISIENQVLTHNAEVTFTKTAEGYTYAVDAKITITATIEKKLTGSGYKISDVTVEYTSYEIGGSAA